MRAHRTHVASASLAAAALAVALSTSTTASPITWPDCRPGRVGPVVTTATAAAQEQACMDSGPVPAVLPQAATAVDSTTVLGQWLYYAEDGVTARPCRHCEVRLYRYRFWVLRDELLATACTDEDGRYRFDNVTTSGSVYVTIHVSNEAAHVLTPEGFLYWSRTGKASPGDFGTRVIDGQRRGALYMLEAVTDACRWFQSNLGYSRDPVRIEYPQGNVPNFDWDVTDGSNRITIPQGWEWRRADDGSDARPIFVHEYGHAVMFRVYGNQMPPSLYYSLPHSLTAETDGGLALTEGWAEFVSAAVEGRPDVAGGNLETNDYWLGQDGLGSEDAWDGLRVEGAVASILWDTLDGGPGDDDLVDRHFGSAWSIIRDTKPSDIQGLWSQWSPRDRAIWGAFFDHGIDNDRTAPSVPTVTSPTHPDPGRCVDEPDPQFDFSATDGLSGVAGFRYGLDGEPTIPVGDHLCLYDVTEGVHHLSVCAIDRADNIGPSTTFTFQIGPPNAEPTLPRLAVAPPQPRDGDNVKVTISGSVDPEGDPIIYWINWSVAVGRQWVQKRGRITSRAYDALPASLTSAGQAWKCVVIATDEPSTSVQPDRSRAVAVRFTIASSAPSTPALSLTPAAPGDADNVTARVSGCVDPDGDPITYTCGWFVASGRQWVLKRGRITARPYDTLPASLTANGQTWKCRVVASDGVNQAPAVEKRFTISSTGTAGVAAAMVTSLSAVPTARGAQIVFTLSAPAEVQAEVLNIAGRPVKLITPGSAMAAGTQTMVWTGQSDAGLPVPNGTYLVRVTARGADGSSSQGLGTVTVRR